MVEQHLQEQDVLNTRFGVIASTMANIKRDPKKRSTPFKPQDFFPVLSSKSKAKPEPAHHDPAAMLDDFAIQMKTRSRMRK